MLPMFVHLLNILKWFTAQKKLVLKCHVYIPMCSNFHENYVNHNANEEEQKKVYRSFLVNYKIIISVAYADLTSQNSQYHQ